MAIESRDHTVRPRQFEDIAADRAVAQDLGGLQIFLLILRAELTAVLFEMFLQLL